MKTEFTLKEIQRQMKVPQHVLIHLCEKGVIIPEFEDTKGRGKWRKFSIYNVIEFSIALELRKYDVSIAIIGAIIRVLHSFQKLIRTSLFPPPGSAMRFSPSVRFTLHLYDAELLVFCFEKVESDPEKEIARQKSYENSPFKPKIIRSFNIDKAVKGDMKRVHLQELAELPERYVSCLTVDISALIRRTLIFPVLIKH